MGGADDDGGTLNVLPGTGRWQRAALTEGGFREGHPLRNAPSTILRMVPPRPGEDQPMR